MASGLALRRLAARAVAAGQLLRFPPAALRSTRPISAVAEVDGIGGSLDPDPHTFPAKSRDSRWWKADPKTGCWVPEDQFEKEINTAQTVTQRPRSVPTASLEDRGWWSSLEELPADRN